MILFYLAAALALIFALTALAFALLWHNALREIRRLALMLKDTEEDYFTAVERAREEGMGATLEQAQRFNEARERMYANGR